MANTYRYNEFGWVVLMRDDGSSTSFPPTDESEYWREIEDDVANGTIVIAPPVSPSQTFAAREREETETALIWALDDTQKIAALSKLTIGE